ncbi:MAG: trypsin-like peptidase domain-containing protein [Clostridiales bacterium]|nr:trypsin-like peptidase domain-containing protein [Clostridiales bacterium]
MFEEENRNSFMNQGNEEGQAMGGQNQDLNASRTDGTGDSAYGAWSGAERNHFSAGDGQDWEQQRRYASYIPEDRPEKKGKKPSQAAKIAGVTAAALLFGVVAGGTMFGVNSLGEYVKSQYVTEAEAETEPVTIAQAQTQGEPDASSQTTASASPAIMMDVSSIVEEAMPSVVAINNTMTYEQRTWFGQSQTVEVPSSGSGIIVGQNDEELLIVTNNHVVEDSKELTVTFIDDEQVGALIKGTDSDSDLAVIAVQLSDILPETMSKIKIATLGDSDELKVGQGVIAIGNALGYGQSVTVGYISALDREVQTDDSTTKNLLQTDAAINPGNSGGALLNMNGEVIGINAAKYSSTSVEGMGYAIPISQAEDIINELMSKKTRVTVEESKQGYLGIQGQNIDETAAQMYDMPRGIYVYKIVEDSAAAASDLREKDIITKFDGQSVKTMAELKDMLTYYEGGDTVELTVQSLQDGQYVERTVSITLGTKPAAEVN